MGETLTRSPAVDPVHKVAVELLEGSTIAAYWPHIEDMLDRVPHTWPNRTKESFLHDAIGGKLQIWCVGSYDRVRLVLFTQIAVHPATRVLEVIWACGAGMLETAGIAVDGSLEHFAELQGCSRIDVIGRSGWEKILAPWGFVRTAVILSRPVSNRSVN